MKKRLIPCIMLIAAMICSFSAYAMEVPTDTVIQNLNGVQQCIKTFNVGPGTDPQELIEEPFEYEGFVYKYASIVKTENEYADEMQQTQAVTVETAKKNLSTVLDALPVSVEYDDGRYAGTLYLDHSTIETVASGYASRSYTISATKEYGNLDSNDMSYVPSTTIKDGKTLPLVNVVWEVQGSALVDDVLVPSVYKAIATYSDKAYYSAATGYVTTADYVGTVECQEISSVTYTVIYTGDEADSHGLTVTGAWLYVVAGLLIVAAAGTVVYVLRCRNPKGSTIRKGVSRKECER